jgi:hypothetical protein
VSGFTPGPWRLDKYGKLIAGEGQFGLVKIHSPWIEEAWAGDEEADANMALIAAAPALYEALRECYGYTDLLRSTMTHAPKIDAALERAKAALAQAEGRP